MLTRRIIIILCAMAAFAATADLCAEIVRKPYATGEKRARIEHVETADAEPAASAATTATAKPEKTVAQTKSESTGSSKLFGMKPLMRKAKGIFEAKARKTAEFIATLENRNLDFDIVSNRAPYLPRTGPANVRFGSNAPFDRSRNFGLAAYQKMLDDKRTAEEAARAEEARRLADLEAARKAAEAEHAVKPPQSTEKVAAASQKTVAEATPGDGVNSLQNKDINPEALFRFFDTGKNKSDVKEEVSFVMPYQIAPPPLVMESKASYTETNNAPEDAKPAK